MSPRRPTKASHLATALIEHSSDAIVVVDETGTVLFANPAAAKIAGQSITEIVGSNMIRWVHEDDVTAYHASFNNHLEQPGVAIFGKFRLRHADGSWRFIESTGVNRLGDPTIGGIIINYRDVTERRRAEEAILAGEARLRQAQKIEAIGRLAGGVAHDFNNVLTAILGSADLLSLQLDAGDPRSEEAEAIKRAAERGAALTRQLLSFSRPAVPTTAIVDLAAIAETVEPMLKRLVLDKIAIVVVACSQPIPVRADESQLSQVLMNLVVNARDAMPNGGTATITLGIADLDDSVASKLGVDPGRYAMQSVRDTGEGIPADVRAHLFEPFFTTKPPELGTGLGLSIVYGIVKTLGGAIDVQSEMGQGATFTIYLPLAA